MISPPKPRSERDLGIPFTSVGGARSWCLSYKTGKKCIVKILHYASTSEFFYLRWDGKMFWPYRYPDETRYEDREVLSGPDGIVVL